MKKTKQNKKYFGKKWKPDEIFLWKKKFNVANKV